MGVKYVTDTHPLLWHLAGSPRLGANAKAILLDPASELVIPAMAYAEACWIVEHGRVPALTVAKVRTALDTDPRFVLYAVDRIVIDRSLSLTVIREMHDRQIVATTLCMEEAGESVALLTQDANITESGLVPVVW